MLELTWMGTVLRGIGFLYWLLAIGAVWLAIKKGKDRRAKTLWAVVVIAVFGFLPAKAMIEQAQRNAYAREAWAYFKKLCDEKSGEKIYKTYTGVKSVLVVKPLPSATDKDHYDQFWYGDPYSASAGPYRSQLASTFYRDITLFDIPTKGFDFVELTIQREQGASYERLAPLPSDPQRENSKTVIDKPVSRFGVKWEDISTPDDRKYWVAGSRFSIIDLKDNSLVAERIGYFIEAGFGSKAGQRRPWLTSRGPNTTCPPIRNGTYEDRILVLKVLNATERKQDGQ